MMRALAAPFRYAAAGLLHSASLFAPGSQRAEWLREWQSELWHVRKACAQPGGSFWCEERTVLAFCLGAFQDAWCLSREGRRPSAPPVPVNGSAGRCLLALTAVLATSYALGLLVPEVRAAHNSQPYTARPGLILIQEEGEGDKPFKATIPFEIYRRWSAGRHRYFDGFAFYRMSREEVAAGSEAPVGWQIAESSSNLFAMLGLPVHFESSEENADGHSPRVILSYKLWKNEFAGNPGIVGSVLRVGQRTAKIVGVAADRVWKLPGQPDAWLLEPDAGVPGNRMGHVLAHLTHKGRSEMWANRVSITAYNSDHSEQDYLGIALDDRLPGPWDIYRFSLVLALLALPAVTSVSLGEYSVSAHRLSWPRRMVRWSYLAAKLALLLPIAYCASLDCAYWHPSQHSSASEYAQLLISFSICLFGIRWALFDQRQRCPVCLKRVAHPAQVGLASRTFLAWNGTELMCTGGHTLLHVPGLPTSWFDTQQWLYLDASWEFLFAGPEAR